MATRTLALLFALATLPLQASDPPIQLSVSANFGYQPLSVTAKLTIPPDYENRGVCVVWDSGQYGGAGCWELNGQYAAPHQIYEIRALPAGTYAVWAELLRVRGNVHSLTHRVQVIDRLQ